MALHPGVDRAGDRHVLHYIPEHLIEQIAQSDMVVRVVDVDAYIERPDEEILGDDPATLDVQEVVGIGYQGANHFRARRGRNDSVGVDVGSRSSSLDLVRVMEGKIGDSST